MVTEKFNTISTIIIRIAINSLTARKNKEFSKQTPQLNFTSLIKMKFLLSVIEGHLHSLILFRTHCVFFQICFKY